MTQAVPDTHQPDRARVLPKYLSHSSMAAYSSCPKKFEFSRIDKIPEQPSRAMLVGTFVHDVLERLMGLGAHERTVEAARNLCRTRWDGWFESQPDFVALDLDRDGQLIFRKDAWKAIEGYFSIEDPGQVQVMALEKRVETKFGDASVLGFIDRLEERSDLVVVSDYKTGKVPAASYKQEALDQPYLYAAMLEQLGTPVSEYRILYINSGIEVSDEIRPDHLAGARQRVETTWVSIKRDFERDHFETRKTKLCNWCSFQGICPAWQN